MEGLLRLLENSEEVQWVRGFDWDSEDASVYLSAADVCVLPFDGGVYMNNSSFAAAIAHGLPVISTRGDLVEYQLVDQENVYLCPPRNVEALTEAVETIISSASLRTRLQSGAKKLAREWFNWDVAIERTVATFSFNDN
jgi:glycosyltransferase involved in cell wall biosynthesis